MNSYLGQWRQLLALEVQQLGRHFVKLSMQKLILLIGVAQPTQELRKRT